MFKSTYTPVSTNPVENMQCQKSPS